MPARRRGACLCVCMCVYVCVRDSTYKQACPGVSIGHGFDDISVVCVRDSWKGISKPLSYTA